jgi:hypothetical protein
MRNWHKQLGVLLLFKIAYLLLVTQMVLLFPAGKDSEMGPVDHIRWTAEGHPTFESYFTTWDAGHYLYLSEHGYHTGQEQCAFYPLWPLVIRWFSILTGGDLIISGMILANAFSLAGFFIFFRLVAKRLGESIAWGSVALLLAFPGSLFFQFIYSESLFFLLVMLVSLGLEHDRMSVAISAAFLLPLTRAIGIFCVFPIALHLIRQWPKDAWPKFAKRLGVARWTQRLLVPDEAEPLQAAVAAASIRGPNWWLLAAPFYGWAVYFLLMWGWTNNPFEGFGAQRFWGVQSINNLVNVPKFAVALFTPTCWHGYIGSGLDRLAFVMLLYTLPLIWRLDKVWLAWAIVLGVVPAMSGDFTSFTRFASTVFPVFAALAAWFMQKGRGITVLGISIFIVLVVLHAILLRRFVYFQWAG